MGDRRPRPLIGLTTYRQPAPSTSTAAPLSPCWAVAMTFNEPLGVVAAIVPWNFPLAIASWKIGPALATGNVIVAKPAEVTPLTALRLAELALDAGIAEGVPQVDLGRGALAGARLVEHPDVAKVAFTGVPVTQLLCSAGSDVVRTTGTERTAERARDECRNVPAS